MAPSDVDLLEMRDATVARGYCDVLELHVHVVLRWGFVSMGVLLNGVAGARRTFNQLSAVDLARCDFQRYDVALLQVSAVPQLFIQRTYRRFVEKLDGYPDCARHDYCML